MAITITKPTVGGSEDSWGTTINTALDTVVNAVNGTSGTLAPNLSTLTINSANVTATAAEINKLAGANVTTTELNYLDNVTSNIQTQFNNVQTQLNAKADEASPSFTGTVGLPENWSFSISGTGASSKLVFAYNGTAVMSISAAGALVTDDNITAFGTP
jgi:hypothetical protein|tara:strand:- start:3678 stop:4154 length:477 start_codon:yes stop_codon:yes gene_type:complete